MRENNGVKTVKHEEDSKSKEAHLTQTEFDIPLSSAHLLVTFGPSTHLIPD